MEGKWLPNNILPDIILGEDRNKKLSEAGKREIPIDFCPVPYNKEDILWWHVPEFLEDNKNNLTYDKIAGVDNWAVRILTLENFYKEDVRPYINKLYESGLWSKKYIHQDEDSYVDEDRRFDIFNKFHYISGASCNGRMGYAISGLYVDFEKLKELFKGSPSEAERIIDNNIFVGDMATFYTAAVENKEPSEKCERLKQKYVEALNMVTNNSKIHLTTKYYVQKELTLSFKEGKKLSYSEMLYEHLDTLKANSYKRSAIEPL